MRTLFLLPALLFLAACSGCRKSQTGNLTAPDCTLVEEGFGPDGTVPITVEVVAEGLDTPWSIAWLPGGEALVTERPGRVRLLRAGGLQPTPVATVRISASGESGLLGIAVPPDFASDLTWEDAVPPGGAALYTGEAIPEWKGSLLVGSLGARHLHRVVFSPDNPRQVTQHEVYLRNQWGRLREVIMGPDGHLYVTTSNCDGRGDCGTRKDVILRIRR